VADPPIWFRGATCTGKTAALIQSIPRLRPSQTLDAATSLVFAANGDNRLSLIDRLQSGTQGQCAFYSATVLGFIQDEIKLFWPLLIEKLDLKAQFPLLLRPENEQELALQLWQPLINQGRLCWQGVADDRLIRRILDWQQLAAISATDPQTALDLLKTNFPGVDAPFWVSITFALQQWRQWCLARGLLTYGLMAELYHQSLLPHPLYQTQLWKRFWGVFADDVDEYPAIARLIFELFIQQGLPAAFTYNAEGKVRLGMGADPDYLEELEQHCQVVVLDRPPIDALIQDLGETMLATIEDPLLFPSLPESVQSIQTISRAQLLRQTANVIIEAIRAGQAEPHDIAVIAPGLDAIARYTLREMLTKAGIPVVALNEQRPLIDVPVVRALLTLLALVYPGLGRTLDRDSTAEMLVTLTASVIDPIRAGLITDHCFEPHPDTPKLLPVTAFPRWDRLGYQSCQAYDALLHWIAAQQLQYQQRLLTSPVMLLDRAIQQFLWNRSQLTMNQMSALRELLEAAQRYWDIQARLQQSEIGPTSSPVNSTAIGSFIQLLQGGAVTANPYPVRSIVGQHRPLTLANVFQYRSSRSVHRWQFWLDAGSPRWLTGIDALTGFAAFLKDRAGVPWTAVETSQAQEQRLRRILQDLLSRAQDRIYLCHSDLAVNGQEQVGPLLSLINVSTPVPSGLP
jgi:hypothetical protein